MLPDVALRPALNSSALVLCLPTSQSVLKYLNLPTLFTVSGLNNNSDEFDDARALLNQFACQFVQAFGHPNGVIAFHRNSRIQIHSLYVLACPSIYNILTHLGLNNKLVSQLFQQQHQFDSGNPMAVSS